LVRAIEMLLRGAAGLAPQSMIDRATGLARRNDPFDRSRFDPGHFTASGFVVSPDGSSLLLIHHRRLDRWLQPGGHIDPEDVSPIAAAAREVLEETGIGTEPILGDLIDLDIHPIPPHALEPAHEHFDLRFGFRALDTDVMADEEVNDAAWVSWSQIESYEVDDSVIRGARRLRRACS
jgi:8-oxo-dGTP pyrophosphatase MutT (NUDIX family)